ncbi:uncharacterized protein [Oscarella lobularis]|uniref:uncharacterized protein isoform X2 n=1 Tax=Oscarella lobularis TaxID=121494 RepID=UPI003313C730
MLSFFLLVLYLALSSSSCPSEWKEFQGNCFKFSAPVVRPDRQLLVEEPTTATWHDARLVCLNLAADLASVHSKAENEFIRSQLPGNAWIGYVDQSSEYHHWTDGSSTSFDYVNWAPSALYHSSSGSADVYEQSSCVYMSVRSRHRPHSPIAPHPPAFAAKSAPDQRRRRRRQAEATAYGVGGEWFDTVKCSSVKKYYVCKKAACCQDSVAVANLVSNSERNITGTVLFQQSSRGGPTLIRGIVKGLHPGNKHGFHIHQKSDNREGCKSYGGHYNPFHARHGGRLDVTRHVGDLGNTIANDAGIASFTMHDNWVQLIGTYSVLNRGVVVHARSDDEGRGDDEGSIATGNAGHRLACGAILCRSCLETLRAEAPVQSDDGSASGLYAFQQTINQGIPMAVSGDLKTTTVGSAEYTHSHVAFLSYEDYLNADKKCDDLIAPTSSEIAKRDDEERTSGIIDLFGKILVNQYRLIDEDGNVTKTTTLCGAVWPAPDYECACANLTNNGFNGEICFTQQSCGGPVKISGTISSTDDDLPSSVVIATHPYGLSFGSIEDGSCPVEDATWIEVSSHTSESADFLTACDTTSTISLNGFHSIVGRTLLFRSVDESDDRVACGTVHYSAACHASSTDSCF